MAHRPGGVISKAYFTSIVAVVVVWSATDRPSPAATPQIIGSGANDSISPGFFSPPPGVVPVNKIDLRRFPHARRSYAWRYHGGRRELIEFANPIQHVVVVYMENRTPENLFAGYYYSPSPTTAVPLGVRIGLADPATLSSPLPPTPLNDSTDPNHGHDPPGFESKILGNYSGHGYTYVQPGSPSITNYLTLFDDWAFEDHTLQSNEGPSFVAHQYAIAGQSGGLNSGISPFAEAENPTAEVPDPGYGTCFSVEEFPSQTGGTINMTLPYPGDPESEAPPCQDYQTLLDLLVSSAPPETPPYQIWQYIAFNQYIIWAAPMAVTHLYQEYLNGGPIPSQPFAVDPDAENFVQNITWNGTPPSPNPVRPFAELTYVTPCEAESDHPNSFGDDHHGVDNGPQWLAWLLDAIGNSPYWQNTAVIVTWDDWGGFYDNYTPAPAMMPYHPPLPNAYSNALDPNEWGFRVPLFVISPYVTSQGYVSTDLISQGAILNYIENNFGLGTGALKADDYNNHNEDLSDMFNYSNPPLAWQNLPTEFVPQNNGTCPPHTQLP